MVYKKKEKKILKNNFVHLVEDYTVTLVCTVVLNAAGRELSLMATLLLFIIGLLPLSCHHSEHFFSQGIVLWDSIELGWLWLLRSVAHCVMLHVMHSHTTYFLTDLLLEHPC